MNIDIQEYWSGPPPEPSPKLGKWIAKIQSGWTPNKRIRALGYYSSAEFFQIYLWEYLNVIRFLQCRSFPIQGRCDQCKRLQTLQYYKGRWICSKDCTDVLEVIWCLHRTIAELWGQAKNAYVDLKVQNPGADTKPIGPTDKQKLPPFHTSQTLN